MWLPEPEPGARICLGFDGSDTDDWTCLRAETFDGYLFTPRYGPDRLPTLWNPAEHFDHRAPRLEILAAIDELFDTFDVSRLYADPPRWTTEIESLALRYGDERVIQWPTYRPKQMHASLERFVTDLQTGEIEHDGCPITERHAANARKVGSGRDKYVLDKPNRAQKIDAAMASVLAHEAACDARASGWGAEVDSRMIVFR